MCGLLGDGGGGGGFNCLGTEPLGFLTYVPYLFLSDVCICTFLFTILDLCVCVCTVLYLHISHFLIHVCVCVCVCVLPSFPPRSLCVTSAPVSAQVVTLCPAVSLHVVDGSTASERTMSCIASVQPRASWSTHWRY